MVLSIPFLWNPGLVSEDRQVPVNSFVQTQFVAEAMFLA